MSKNNWDRNDVQFPRLIAELEAAGVFSADLMDSLSNEMDLTTEEISQLIWRAQDEWEKVKNEYCPIKSS